MRNVTANYLNMRQLLFTFTCQCRWAFASQDIGRQLLRRSCIGYQNGSPLADPLLDRVIVCWKLRVKAGTGRVEHRLAQIMDGFDSAVGQAFGKAFGGLKAKHSLNDPQVWKTCSEPYQKPAFTLVPQESNYFCCFQPATIHVQYCLGNGPAYVGLLVGRHTSISATSTLLHLCPSVPELRQRRRQQIYPRVRPMLEALLCQLVTLGVFMPLQAVQSQSCRL